MEQIPEGHERVFIHPFHHHELALRDTRDIYKRYEARWRCDCCKRPFDGMSDEEGHRNAYHCHQCTSGFDLCSDCFKGYRHQFHRHRLMPAKSTLCYPQTDGQWRCDACKLVYGKPTGQRCYHCAKSVKKDLVVSMARPADVRCKRSVIWSCVAIQDIYWEMFIGVLKGYFLGNPPLTLLTHVCQSRLIS